jgi:hypothetical protein
MHRKSRAGKSASKFFVRRAHSGSIALLGKDAPNLYPAVISSDERGLALFQMLRQRRNEASAFLFAFDLLELDGTDLRREPIEVRKATLASILRKFRPGCG